MPIVCSPPVDSTSDVVSNRRVQTRSVVELHNVLMGSMGDVHRRREECFQRGFGVNSLRDSMSQGQCGFRQFERRDGPG